ncbi:MAG: hypothetical protein KZQ99_02560 [Candidatus Thiodiazotropha sp. (ex Dulcina madagascariensis)]|nr:hypothetical protein [Candidatus Thiodiazotropha sp. (ex Dulcina madagascariensis)]
MKRLTLLRGGSSPQGTFGRLLLPDGSEIGTTELPWRDNARSTSCIPSGVYPVRYLAKSASGKYRDVYHVEGVTDRSGILIHAGNFAGDRDLDYRSHSWGCILPALRVGYLRAGKEKFQRAGLASRSALRRLHEAVGRRDFDLEVIG